MFKYLTVLVPLLLTGCQLNFSSFGEDLELPPLKQSDRAPLMMRAIAVGQQAYYDHQGQFAGSVESLSAHLNLETESYLYAIETEGESAQTVVLTATAKTDDLPSYAGVMTAGATEGGVMMVANLCQTDEPSKTPPILSSIPVPGEGLKCPPGSSPVR
ncbi:type IV pilin-like G/H family protein [Lyngbya sp. CCY1209]|uniref:type IV pilin-like G/H family protein n=1 Tax=Lyngbya sp. CCY1209 TaxID=2886103 RepID=UPI002D20E8F8|nr:type IV pilin-like G/H family protein [Lyngbya sp. CCY1209]MEB3882847.1 type IV pilin-like G/H family protein [Lyngbya sp. CCY1209]